MNNQSIIDQISSQAGWYVIKVTIQPEMVLNKSITPSKLYRDLSNSKQCFNSGLGNNRHFWKKNMKGGYYFSHYSDDGVLTIYFFVRSVSDMSEKLIRTNVVVRIKRIVPCEVEMGGLELLSPHLQRVFQIPYGMKYLLQPFGECFNYPRRE